MNPHRAASRPAGKPRLASCRIDRLVSGGQTGADRAALDFAIERGIPHGGWCPRGRLAEDGPIAGRYRLVETPSAEYAERTEWNVRDSDATLILTVGPTPRGGSRVTWDCAVRLGRPRLHLSRARDNRRAGERLQAFLYRHRVRVLNVAGPRASSEPDIAGFVRDVLSRALSPAAAARIRAQRRGR